MIYHPPLTEYEKLHEKWIEIRNKDDDESKNKTKHLEEELANKYANEIYEKIQEEIEGLNCEDDGLNSGHIWKLKKKLHTNYPDPPASMTDQSGNLITEKDKIKENTLD